jgi:hypothetical protein
VPRRRARGSRRSGGTRGAAGAESPGASTWRERLRAPSKPRNPNPVSQDSSLDVRMFHVEQWPVRWSPAGSMFHVERARPRVCPTDP